MSKKLNTPLQSNPQQGLNSPRPQDGAAEEQQASARNSGSDVEPFPKDQKETQTSRPDQTPLAKWVLEGAAVLLGIAVAWIYGGQLGEMGSQLNVLKRQADDFETVQEASFAFGKFRSVTTPGDIFQDDITIEATNYGQTVGYKVNFGYEVILRNKRPDPKLPDFIDSATSRMSTIVGSLGPKESKDFTMHISGPRAEDVRSGKIEISVPFDIEYTTIFHHTYVVPDCSVYKPSLNQWQACPPKTKDTPKH